MTKLAEAKLIEIDTIAGRAAILLSAVVDDLDALAASLGDEDARAKVYTLADDYEHTKARVVSGLIEGTPGLPPAEPPKPVAHVAPTVSKEAADHTAKAAVDANGRKRAERPKDADPIKADNQRQWDHQDQLREQEEAGRLDEAAQRRPKSGESIAEQRA